MIASFWESGATYLTVLTPLVAIPLTVITFYLRAIREHQLSWHGECVRRIEAVEAAAGRLRTTIAEFERDYTTKEEWLRECMHARGRIEQLTEATVRIETLISTATACPLRRAAMSRVKERLEV
jgi:hypothetical protein